MGKRVKGTTVSVASTVSTICKARSPGTLPKMYHFVHRQRERVEGGKSGGERVEGNEWRRKSGEGKEWRGESGGD